MWIMPWTMMVLLSLPLLQGCAGAPPAASLCAPGDQACVRRRVDGAPATGKRLWEPAAAAPGEIAPPTARPPTETPSPSLAPEAPRNARRAVPASPVTVAPVVPAPAALPRAAAPSPATPVAPPPAVTACDAGGCWHAGGGRYEGGAGNAYLDGGGRLCQRQGGFMQCF